MGKGILGSVVAGALTLGGFATAPANASDNGQAVSRAIYRVEQPAPVERGTTDLTPAKNESQTTGGILKAELERWRGGGPAMQVVTAKADEIRVPVKTAIYRVEQPDPDEQATTEPSADDEDDSQATGTDMKIDLVRWGRRWGGGWGGGWGYRRFGWGGGYRRFGWGGGFGYRRFGWGGGWGYRRFAYRRFYRPYMYGFGMGGYGGFGGYGYGGGGYGGYGGYPLAYGGGYGYPGYGGGYYW
jgi:hypothetical protein